MASIVQILMAESPAVAMVSCETVRAIAGKGLEGDRYFSRIGTFSPKEPRPDYEITLIELEEIEAFACQSSLPFTAEHARRNIVTRGLRLNDLVGREFFAGEVRIRGIRLCEPCT